MLGRILVIGCVVLSTNLFANESFLNHEKSICGRTDDRSVSFEAPVGRLSVMEKNYGCTVTMIGKSCAISAGHCKSVLVKAEFNTPGSVNREAKPSAPEDVYLIDQDTIEFEDAGRGTDWAVMKIKANAVTGKLPGVVQGYYPIRYQEVPVNTELRITGYGIDNDDDDKHFAQQTHYGKMVDKNNSSSWMRYTVDTMGGNSGSSVRIEATNEIVGIHTHGGCYSYGGANTGTQIAKSPKLIQAIRNCLATE